jgi:hypothetical protein
VSYILRSWRQIERGVQLDLAHHHRRIGTHAQAQQIFDSGLIHGYVEVDVAPRFSLDSHHISPCYQEGMEKLGFDQL